MATILVIDDEEDMLDTIAFNLEAAGHGVLRASSGEQGLQVLDGATPDLIISDVMMGGMDGFAFCAEVRKRPATMLTPFLFVTAKGQAADKVRGLRLGADDYITKPFELDDLLARVNGRLAHRERMRELEEEMAGVLEEWDGQTETDARRAALRRRNQIVTSVREAGHPDYRPPLPDETRTMARVEALLDRYPVLQELRGTMLLGEDPSFLALFEEILIGAASDDPVTIVGETGTGKTGVAEAIWRLGDRASESFQTINCSELAAGDPILAAGKLFGYGANSGIQNIPPKGMPGLLEQADGGVLFLDEVGALPLQAQMLLLLPLEGRPFHPAVGMGDPRTVSVKFVFATNRDLAAEARGGHFPRDLWERIAGDVIRVPPLRDRPRDIELLATHFLHEASPTVTLAADALRVLRAYAWPGNVRELRRVLRRACRRAEIENRTEIVTSDLPHDTRAEPSIAAAASPPRSGDEVFSGREIAELEALRANRFRIGDAENALGYSTRSGSFSHHVRGLQLKALALSAWNVEAAAVLLAGSDESLIPVASRRLHGLLDRMASRLTDGEDKHLQHLLAEHQEFCREALRFLRGQIS